MPSTPVKMTPAQAERIMRQAFRIAAEDGSIEAFGSQRKVETAEFICAEALRRMTAWESASDMLTELRRDLAYVQAIKALLKSIKGTQWVQYTSTEFREQSLLAAIAKAEMRS